MGNSRADRGNPLCLSDSALLATLVAQLDNSEDLITKRAEFYRDVLLIDKLNLDGAKSAAQEAIRRILRTPFAQSVLRQALASFTALEQLRSLVPKATEDLRHLQDDWHSFLDQVVLTKANTPPSDTKYTLLAFSLVTDYKTALTQSELDELVTAIADREGLRVDDMWREVRRRADSRKNQKGGDLDKEIWDGLDLLAAVISLMSREGLKPFVRDSDLQEWVTRYFIPGSTPALGGAAGNEAHMLRMLGEPVLAYAPYHHVDQAYAAPACAKRLVFDKKGAIEPYGPLREGDRDVARRISLVLQLTPEYIDNRIVGPTLVVCGQEYRPQRADRLILQVPNARTDKPAPWRKLRVEWPGPEDALAPVEPGPTDPSKLWWDPKQKIWILEIERHATRGLTQEPVFKGLGQHDWPYLPVFQYRPQIDRYHTLKIELVSAGELGSVAANVRAVLLSSIQSLGQMVFTPALTTLLRVALVTQLQTFSARGIPLHFELSGDTPGKQLTVLDELFRQAGIRHISSNREELVKITSEPGNYFVAPRPGGYENPFMIYWRARHLMKALDLDTYYIHDLELDILLRRNRDGEDPIAVETDLERHRQAMLLAKAAVPQALIQRAGVHQQWHLVLSTESLVALWSFAREFADLVSVEDNQPHQKVLAQVQRTGCYCSPNPSGLSVVVAPAVCIEFCREVNLAGAGDMNFAVHANSSLSHPVGTASL